MELVKRYIYAVTQKLPESQRADIEKELKGLIEDMLEERVQGREASKKDVEEVLLELGNPRELADKYRGYKRYLISPEIFPTYLLVLKIVLISIGIAMSVVFTIQAITDPFQITRHFVNTLASFVSACFQGFAWVTVIFGIVEYKGVRKEKLGIMDTQAWKPSELPPLPDERNRITLSDPIASIIFIVLFAVLFTFSIDLLGVWVFQKGSSATVVPFFNKELFRGFLPFIWIVLVLSILNEIMKLIVRKWTIKLIAFEVLVSILSFVLALFMFSDTAIWNSDFMQQIVQSGLISADNETFKIINTIWNQSTKGLIYLIGVILAIQVIVMGIKAYKIKDIT